MIEKIIDFLRRLMGRKPTPHEVEKAEAKQTLVEKSGENDDARNEFLDQMRQLQEALEGRAHGQGHRPHRHR